MQTILDVLALVAVASLLGGMVFFSAVMAPLVFTKLEAETAARFIRQVFPRYYVYVGSLSAVAALALAVHRPWDALAMALVAGAAAVSRQMLMPRINALRDRELAGDAAAAPRFAALHRATVVINVVQLLVAGAVLVRFVVQA